MKDIDTKDQCRPVGLHGASFGCSQIDDRLRQREGRWGEKNDFILVVHRPLLVFLLISFILFQLFHHLAFPVAMHVKDSPVFAKGSIFSRIGIIVRDDKKPTECLRKKGCEKEEYN
jgi:hypothetical protein